MLYQVSCQNTKLLQLPIMVCTEAGNGSQCTASEIPDFDLNHAQNVLLHVYS